jgi:3-deoxy-D-manno-octulosonate 8-phosphate phosphatase (KDO 8-P phosphatase)
MQCAIKIKTYEDFKKKYLLSDNEIIYVGDDIPDFEIMSKCGCACCPADACNEIKQISTYISQKNGGYGCGRDIVEQVMKAQGTWLLNAKAFGW